MKKYKLFYMLLIIPMLVFYSGCSKDDESPVIPPAINEAEVLITYLEANGDFINTLAPATISAADVRTNQLTPGYKQYIMDTRSQADFENKGHIEGAVRVDFANIVSHYTQNNLSTYDKVVMVCYSGQTASYATSILRLLGYNNVYLMLFGMSAWNSAVSNSWHTNIGNAYATQLTTDVTQKNAPGDLPTLSTGKTDGKDILEASAATVVSEGFTIATVKASDVFSSPSSYYIVNYWSAADYSTGHIPGAIQYTPKSDLKLATALKTLPPEKDKKIVVYCYTGTTSAHIAAYLRILGYNAHTLLFGANSINYDTMPGKKFDPNTDCKEYPFVTGP